MPTWPSQIVGDAAQAAWLPSTVAAGLALRGRSWLLLPVLVAAAVAAFLAAGVPAERWEEAEPVALVGVALVGVAALALGGALATIVARDGPRVARDWTARHARALRRVAVMLAGSSLTAVLALLLLGQLDNAPNGPPVAPGVQASLADRLTADEICYRPGRTHDPSSRRSVARHRRAAHKRFRLLLGTLARSPDAVVTIASYSSDRPDGPGPFYAKYTVRELAEELAEDAEFSLQEGAVEGPAERSCHQGVMQRVRAALERA